MKNKMNQLKYESDCWKRILEFILAESSFCKNRLSDVIRSSTGGTDFMYQAEIYQNYFIQEETLILLIRRDVSQFDKLLKDSILEDIIHAKKLTFNRNKIGNELEKLSKEFAKMKSGFNTFLESN